MTMPMRDTRHVVRLLGGTLDRGTHDAAVGFMTQESARHVVLVVDDDEAERAALADLLVEEGFDVVQAEDGAVALTLLEQGAAPGLVLLDLMMPHMNGWQLLEAMERTARLADIPVIVLTAFDAAKGLPAGCRVLHKPFEKDVLLAEARALTQGPSGAA